MIDFSGVPFVNVQDARDGGPGDSRRTPGFHLRIGLGVVIFGLAALSARAAAQEGGVGREIDALGRAIRSLAGRFPERYPAERHLARLAALAREIPGDAGRARWEAELEALKRAALVDDNPLIDFEEVLFVKRHTYDAAHYYTEYIQSRWSPGGNLCVLNLKTGAVRELVEGLEGGVFERLDLSFDARKVVFAWKAAPDRGYRLYEVNLDGTGLRPLTLPPADEEERVRKYALQGYHHGTDDMQPCYLPDGGLCFISTRCEFGILCDGPDYLTTTVLYRMGGDGEDLQRLSTSSVSESSPAVLPDGRILYTRWEYVDKGTVAVKGLWTMRPDGTGSAELYGNNIALPPTLIYGRAIPGTVNQYVVLGSPHYPQNGLGPVIRLDMNRDIRTRQPMTYLTPYVDVRADGGFHFLDAKSGRMVLDKSGRGPLFKDPYPLSADFHLVSHKPAGTPWSDPGGYGLYLLHESGQVVRLYRDPGISCWVPYPVRPRRRPPIPLAAVDPDLARRNLAVCVVSDVYRGLERVDRGTIRHLRILEQVPRPWAARRWWEGDTYDQQHAVVSKATHLGIKVQHGVVPVEPDGSAHFVVPARANIFFQALDGDYMAVQTERTFVNYMPGERRSCVGCHETPTGAASGTRGVPMALHRPPSVPGPQPGERSAGRPLYYEADVQPVWDRHCLECHSGDRREGALDLSGERTDLFNVSYENLLPHRWGKAPRDRGLLGPVIGENHPKTGNAHYLPPRSLGSHASVLVAMLAPDKVRLRDEEAAARARKLAEAHRDVRLAPEELLRVTNWIDTNCQYYGSYWGRRHLRYKDHPNFRPVPTFEAARRWTSPIPEDRR